ncbi:MAG: gamma-glutamyltransferase family protein [Burkholderiaceae bacterium]
MRQFYGPGRSLVYAQESMCATSHPLASRVAMETLAAGGNAVDAAVSAAVLLGFCEPMMTGLGGDLFALIQLPGQADPIALNASGRSPAALQADRLRSEGLASIPTESAHAVSVPGAVDGFDRLVRDHGRFDLARCLQPAIHYAEHGVPVAPRTARDWEAFAHRLTGRARETLLGGARAYREGEIFRQPEQAMALRLLAEQGRSAFYEGEIAQDMVSSLRAMGGVHTLDDFAATACDYVTPMRIDYRGHELIELPPNGQGATALLMAKLLSRFDLASMDPLGAARAHLEAEIAKIAYDARDRFVADPSFGPLAIEHMLADDTVDALAALIDPQRAARHVHQLTSAVHKDTVYLAVVDRDRMAVSMIYSIFHAFGSGLASDRFGINFQNRGAGLNLIAGHPNELAPRKRPMHTLIPGMLRKRGEYLMPFGVMGGQYQAAGHARFVSNVIDFGMDPQSAMDAPRSFPEPASGELTLEWGYADEVASRLGAMGHHVMRPDVGIGGSQAVRIDLRSGVLTGASDPRKDGCALGR